MWVIVWTFKGIDRAIGPFETEDEAYKYDRLYVPVGISVIIEMLNPCVSVEYL